MFNFMRKTKQQTTVMIIYVFQSYSGDKVNNFYEIIYLNISYVIYSQIYFLYKIDIHYHTILLNVFLNYGNVWILH